MNKEINPKSLKGNEAFKHTLDLMNKLTPMNESVTNASLEFVKRGPNNLTYVIIRENRKYFIKTTKETQFKVEDLEYTGGLQNKLQEAYNTYEDALKQLNLTFRDLNEMYEVKGGSNLFEQDYFDIEDTEDIDEEFGKKYKLRVPNDNPPPAPSPEPSPSFGDQGGSSNPEMESPEIQDVPNDGGEDFSGDGSQGEIPNDNTEDTSDIDIEDEEDPVKYIQKLTGKLGQKIRELTDIDPKLEKYVMNSIVSALHIDKMDKKDRMDIIKKFTKRKGMESDMGEPTAEVAPEPVGESFGEDESYQSVSRKGPFNYQTALSDFQSNNGNEENSTDELDMDAIFQELRNGGTETKPGIKTPVKPYKPKRPSPFNPDPGTAPGPKANTDELERKLMSRRFKKRDIGSEDHFNI